MDWLLVPVAYLVGSVQWGLYVVKLTKRVDIRTVGSGKTGTTNVLRSAGKTAAIVVLLADAGKGLSVALLAQAISDEPALHAAASAAVIAGHIFPVLAGFRGGRGIATGFGTIVGFGVWGPVIGLLVFIPVVAITRYVSLGSVVGVLTTIVVFAAQTIWFDLPIAYAVYVLGAGSLIIGMHRDNIKRLIAGTERRIGQPIT
ncbi:MAG: glycerol-3-phosphate 1-O-acyltransferase PlsY [Chloroflexi bacterium]|nr:glycerol-3-phosphate 1-O-acyltransferase PlsY [Chloroflexota bacterium]